MLQVTLLVSARWVRVECRSEDHPGWDIVVRFSNMAEQLLTTSPDYRVNEFLARGRANVDISDKVCPPNAEDSSLTAHVEWLYFMNHYYYGTPLVSAIPLTSGPMSRSRTEEQTGRNTLGIQPKLRCYAGMTLTIEHYEHGGQ